MTDTSATTTTLVLFQRDIEDLLGVHADFFTDRLIGKPGVTADLLTARPL